MASFLKFCLLIALISLCEEINPATQSRLIKPARKSISKTRHYQMPRLIYSDYDFPDYGQVVYIKVPHKLHLEYDRRQLHELYLRKANSEAFSEENERPWKIYERNQVEKPAAMEPSSDIPPPPFIPYNYDYYDYFFIEAGAGPPPPPPGPPPPGWVWGPLEPPPQFTTTTSTTQASTSSPKPLKTRPPPSLKTTTPSPSKPAKSRPPPKTNTPPASLSKLESKGQVEEAKPLKPTQVQKETPIQKGIKDIAIRGSDQDNLQSQHAAEKPQPSLLPSLSQPSDNPSPNSPNRNFFKVAWNKLIDIFKFSNVYDADLNQQATNDTNGDGIVIDKQENNNSIKKEWKGRAALHVPLFLIN